MEDLTEEYKRLEAYVKTLLNNQLKDILKKEGLQVTGVKAVLQSRILERLNELMLTGDAAGFRDFRQKIKPHAPTTASASSGFMPHYADQYRTMPNGSRPMPHHSSTGGLPFTASPFYKIISPLTKVETLPIMQSNRNSVSLSLVLDSSHMDRLKDASMRIMLYSAADASYTEPNHVAFPQQIEVKINEDTLHANLRGIKKKVGTTRPADITAMVRKVSGYTNRVSMTYAATDRRYQFLVQMVRKYSVEELVQRIEKGNIISKASVLNEMLSIANDDDIAVSSSVMSLKCPLSFMRIQLPCRFSTCKHNQCFDASSFLQTQEQAPQWTCPVCSKVSSFENLVVDEYFRDILRRTPSSTDSVVVEPNGEWRIASQEDEQKPKGNSAKSGRSAVSEDDDFIEIIEAPGLNGVKSEFMTPTLMMSPPFNRREASASSSTRNSAQKRKRDVIDLTLDSDDDDTPAPPPLKKSYNSATTHGSIVAGAPTTSSTTTSSSSYPARGYNQLSNASQASRTATYSSNQPLAGPLPSPVHTANYGGYPAPLAGHGARNSRFSYGTTPYSSTNGNNGASNGSSSDYHGWA